MIISWAEGLLSASGVEHLADFRLHVSFKSLSRSRGTGWLWHEGEGEVPMRREIKGSQESEESRWMKARGCARWAPMCDGEEEEVWTGR